LLAAQRGHVDNKNRTTIWTADGCLAARGPTYIGLQPLHLLLQRAVLPLDGAEPAQDGRGQRRVLDVERARRLAHAAPPAGKAVLPGW